MNCTQCRVMAELHIVAPERAPMTVYRLSCPSCSLHSPFYESTLLLDRMWLDFMRKKCPHCHRTYAKHGAGGKCLFGPTHIPLDPFTFAPIGDTP